MFWGDIKCRTWVINGLSFDYHFNYNVNKGSNSIGLLRKISTYIPRKTLVPIYESFKRPLLDHIDGIYDQAFNESFHERLESIPV